MPFYRRRFYGRRRWYGGRYNRRWRRGWYRRSGVNRAQSNATRRFKLVVPATTTVDLSVPQGGNEDSNVRSIFGLCNTAIGGEVRGLCSLLCPSVIAYCRLYDEVKIDWVSVNINCLDPFQDRAEACTLGVSIDRRFSHTEYTDQTAAPNNLYPNVTNVFNSSSCQQLCLNTSSKRSMHVFCGAQDLIERVQFFDCDKDANNTYFRAWVDAGSNPNFFCPAIFMAARAGRPTAADAGLTFHFRVDVKWGLTFRNPKYVPAGGAARGVEDVEPVRSEGAGKDIDNFDELVDGLSKYIRERPEPGDGEIDAIVERMEARKKAKLDALRLARKKARLEKIKKLRKELEKDDDTLIDPEEEVLPDDDLLDMDDDDAPTQPIRELENKSSS